MNPAPFNTVGKQCPRITWTNGLYFVALSVLDGEMRGAAAATLWHGRTFPDTYVEV
jgi:hypothetical protein